MLDADDNPLVDRYGKKMARDIVQFVPLREFQTRSGANFSLVRTITLCQLFVHDNFTVIISFNHFRHRLVRLSLKYQNSLWRT